MRFEIGSATDVGQVRPGNEDDLLVDDALGLIAVADGMGGHQAGEVASATALEAIRAAAARGTALTEAIEYANSAVFDKAAGDPDLRGMGTTVTAFTTRNGAQLGHVGDSRAYLLRAGELEQLTTDHSLVEELVREGRLTPEEAAVHPRRSVITRALGIEPTVQVDRIPLDLVTGDRLLLCSDGLTSMLRDDDIAKVLRRIPEPARVARALIDAANAAGGDDNITVIILDVVDDELPPGIVTPVAAVDHPEGIPEEAPPEAAPTVADSIAPGADITQAVPAVSVRPPDVEDERPPRRTGRTLGRIALAALPIIVVIGLAVAATRWYAYRDYYIGAVNGRVVVYNGTPGGLLGFNPERTYVTSVHVDDLSGADRNDVRDNRTFASRSEVDAFVGRLEDAVATATSTTTSTSSTSTTTLLPGAPTTIVGP